MTRDEFRIFCTAAGLNICDAGRNWRDAGVNGAYLCAIISSADDYDKVRALIDRDDAYLASAEVKNGQSWFEFLGYGKIFANDAADAAQQMAKQYAAFLAERPGIIHWDVTQIGSADEDEAAPDYVTEPGYWEGDSLVFSEQNRDDGIWSYRYDNWSQHVILVFNDEKNTSDPEND